jgi:hypothetical protein
VCGAVVGVPALVEVLLAVPLLSLLVVLLLLVLLLLLLPLLLLLSPLSLFRLSRTNMTVVIGRKNVNCMQYIWHCVTTAFALAWSLVSGGGS